MLKQHDQIAQLLTDDSFLRRINDKAVTVEQQRWDHWLEEGEVHMDTADAPRHSDSA